MTLQTESAHVAEVAFAAACRDRDDVIGIPQRLTPFQTPGGSGLEPGCPAETADVRVFGDAICAAQGANPFVAFEDARAQMSRITAETPFFDAEGGTERVAPGGHFELAPAAQATAVWTFG